MLWTSGIGLLGAMAGFWIGLLRVRFRRRYKSGSVSPYQGWMQWHHVAGLVGGLFLITWVFSGWLSMSPWGGLRDGRRADAASLYVGARPGFPPVDGAALASAAKLLKVGEHQSDPKLPAEKLAAATTTAGALLNMDATLMLR